MEIKLNTRNDLFNRNEINAEIKTEKNPSFDGVKKMLSEEIGKPEENINVYNITGRFGLKKFDIDAYVYDSKKDLEKARQITNKQRKQEKEDSKKAYEEAKAEKNKEVKEKPAEEVSEESVEEKPVEEVKE